jgi:EmrB/QacA subfamily drug resistance transporter
VSARTWILVATILGSSMAFVDATVVNVALPAIGRDLGLGLAGRQWVFLSYSLALASLYLLAGALGDRLGRQRVFLLGTGGFAVASALAAASPDGAFLLTARALQGVAAAFVSTTSLALLRATFGEESGRAVGLWTAWTGIATIAGPPAGGALVEWASWRLIFLVNLPLAGIAALLAHRYADDREREDPSRGSFDVVGAGLLAGGLALGTYGLVERGPWWAVAAGAALVAVALAWESRVPEPLLPLGLFRERSFAAANAETFLVYAALSASGFYLVLYLQSVAGYSPLESSLPWVPVSVVMLLLAGRFGRLADRHGPRLYLAAGPALIAGGMICWTRVVSRDSWPWLAAGVALFALGLAMTVAPITATALAAAPERLAGVAAGVNNTVSRIGGLVAVAVVGAVIAATYDGPGTPLTASGARDPSVHAFRVGMLVAAGIAAAGALVGASWIPARAAREGRRAARAARMRRSAP